jgi:hypothetical protein
MLRSIGLGLLLAIFAVTAVQAKNARLEQCNKKKQACYFKCDETRAIPGEGAGLACQSECDRWFNACRGKGSGPTRRNKSKNRRR